MSRVTSKDLKKVEDEIRALKVTQPLNGGALTKHSAEASWSGVIDKNSPISPYSMLAAFEATFHRDDGVTKTPFVQFAYTLEPDITSYSHSKSFGAVISAEGDEVTFKIVLSDKWWAFDDSQTTGNLKLTVNGYSPVEGWISIERVYS